MNVVFTPQIIKKERSKAEPNIVGILKTYKLLVLNFYKT